MPEAFLVVSLVGAWFTFNALRPLGWKLFLVPGFFAGWLTSELAMHHLFWQAIATFVFIAGGALDEAAGWVGLAITLLSWVGLVVCIRRSLRGAAVVERALLDGLGADYVGGIIPELIERYEDRLPWRQIVLPFPMRSPEVVRTRNIEYGRVGKKRLLLDVYQHESKPAGRPALLQVHGGAWVIGSKRDQGIPLCLHMASRGWVCFNADYRLSPRATFPDHLVDLKRAIAWIREHGAEYGADPRFIAVTGGSAGGHLSALLALTANDPEYQPGFEDADTSLQACVPFYGVYDFTNREGVGQRDLRRFLERVVMKSKMDEAREAWDRASPMSCVRADAPPFFVVHGELDSLVPVAEARLFVKLLREVGCTPVAYAEFPGAQHAFEVFPSLRTAFAVKAVERFLGWAYSRHVEEREATAPIHGSPAEPARSTR
jgi:acetyl esterase/lipase